MASDSRGLPCDRTGSTWCRPKNGPERPSTFHGAAPGAKAITTTGPILRGEAHCRSLLGGSREYVTPKQDQVKGLSLYATASGRLYVNAGPPDAWLGIDRLPGWDSAIAGYDRDALMNLAVNNPTAVLYAVAREADPGIAVRADTENFGVLPGPAEYAHCPAQGVPGRTPGLGRAVQRPRRP